MDKKYKSLSIGILMICMLFIANAQANEEIAENIPITADQAFDAYADQIDPESGEAATVFIVDVRTTAEYYWVGTAAQVDSITTNSGRKYFPYNGKVKMRMGSRFLKFEVQKGEYLRSVFLPVSRVAAIDTLPIADHIPLKTWDDEKASLVDNFDDFNTQMADLAGEDTVVILMCRSGKRSNYVKFARDKFKAVYEVDQPDGTDGRGGFEGTAYNDVYNGYRGFPGRNTDVQESPSVSWSDAGLPTHIGWKP